MKNFGLFFLFTFLLLPILLAPFGAEKSLGAVAGLSFGFLVVSYMHWLVNMVLKKGQKVWLWSVAPRLLFLAGVVFLLLRYQPASMVAFCFSFAIIIFILLIAYGLEG